MEDIPRRTLPELAFIYDRDPRRRDVYVEGPSDASVIKWFMAYSGIPNVAVYPIESIEVPDGELLSAGLKTGNRGRVQYLAAVLATSSAEKAACLIDADFSILRNEPRSVPPLFQTDYACMEMYYFASANLRKFFAICCNRADWPVEEIINALVTVLQEFFLCRFANDDLEWNLDWLDKLVCLSLNGWKIELDMESFVTRLLNKNNRSSQRDMYLEHVAYLREHLTDDPRNQMNGHDLTTLLAWYLRNKRHLGVCTQRDSVEACMRMTLDHEQLRRERMFQELADHLA